VKRAIRKHNRKVIERTAKPVSSL